MSKRRIPYIHLIPLLLISFVLYKLVDSSVVLTKGMSYIVSLFSFFLWGFGIAYFLNPLVRRVDTITKNRRWLTLCIVYALVIGAVVIALSFIVPRLTQSIVDLAEQTDEYYETTERFLTEWWTKLQLSENNNIAAYIESLLLSAIEYVPNFLKGVVSGIAGEALKFTLTSFRVAAGLMISIYMLKDKERIGSSFVRLLHALFDDSTVNEIVRFAKETNSVFSKFIIGKFIDSVIIGVMCYVGLLLLRVPYAILISLIIGVTNMIPYFGPFIGAIPAVIITLFVSPVKAFWVAVFVLALQQFDGWYLGPLILGESVGLRPLWILLAITLGGGLYGPLGMFVGVPVMALISSSLERFVHRRLREKEKKRQATALIDS